MLLVGFTLWGIVCLRHSWKAMWTRLADWVVMSNSVPQREDEPPCGLHGWVVSMWCNHVHTHVWGPTQNKFPFSAFEIPRSRRPVSHFYHLLMFTWGSGVSVRSEWHTRIPRRTSQFRIPETQERWAQNLDKGPHSETPQGHLSACTSHFFTSSPPPRTGPHPPHRRELISNRLYCWNISYI